MQNISKTGDNYVLKGLNFYQKGYPLSYSPCLLRLHYYINIIKSNKIISIIHFNCAYDYLMESFIAKYQSAEFAYIVII